MRARLGQSSPDWSPPDTQVCSKREHGHAVFSPDDYFPPPAPHPFASLNVSAKTPDITAVDHDLDIKDEENNKFQQEILHSYFVENKKTIVDQSEASKKVDTLDVSASYKNDDSSYNDISSDQACQDRSPTYKRRPDNLVEYEMELIQFEENNISNQMTLLEHRIREAESQGCESQDLLNDWFKLISKKNIIFHRRLMIEILQDEQDLERRCEILQTELRIQDIDHQTEQLLLEELIRLVDLRDKLVSDQNDEEDHICQEESIGKEVQYCQISKYSKCPIQ